MTSEAFAHLKVPTVHLNGTSKAELLDQLLDADEALRAAIEALHRATPHARDYYPQGNGVFTVAHQQHQARLNQVRLVTNELAHIALAIEGI